MSHEDRQAPHDRGHDLPAGLSDLEDWTGSTGHTTRYTRLEFGNSGSAGFGEALVTHFELARNVSGRWSQDSRVAAVWRPADLANLRISFCSGTPGGRSPQALVAERHRRGSQHSWHSRRDSRVLVYVCVDHSCRSICRNGSGLTWASNSGRHAGGSRDGRGRFCVSAAQGAFCSKAAKRFGKKMERPSCPSDRLAYQG